MTLGVPAVMDEGMACLWTAHVDDSPCAKMRGHDTPHRVYDPYGAGLWIEYDPVTEEETARSISWQRTQPYRPKHRAE